MKKLLSAFLLLLSLSAGAQQTVGELFKTMPDSLMPLLTTNNRLDMIDFLDAKMKALVVNKLEGESEMTSLTADSLSVRVSNSEMVRLYLVPTSVAYDSCQQVLRMEKDYFLPYSGSTETVVHFFTVRWKPLDPSLFADHPHSHSSILRHDDKVFDTKPLP